MGRSTTADTAVSRLLSSLRSALLLVLCCCCCSCDARPVHSFSPRVLRGTCTYSLGTRELGLSWQRHAASFCSVWGRGVAGNGGSWRSRALATATARGEMVAGRRASEDRGVRERGVWMKANKKNKRKREQRQPNDSADSGGGAPKPQRVTKNAPVSVRTQIKYAKMRKSMERAPRSKFVHNKYRRVKTYDYEDVVEPEDLSHIYMPDIAPSLMVDGYNIMFYWSKCCMMADNGDLEGARQLLVEELDTLSAMRGWTVTVVFDAYKRKGGNRRKYITPNNIEVVFTSHGESADMYVERLTEELKDAGCPNVMVATGDKLMQSLVIGAGAEVFSPDRIIEEIEVCHQEAVAYTDMYMRKKESMIEKSEMQDLLDRVRSVEEKAKRRGRGGGGGGRGNSGPTFNIEDDL